MISFWGWVVTIAAFFWAGFWAAVLIYIACCFVKWAAENV